MKINKRAIILNIFLFFLSILPMGCGPKLSKDTAFFMGTFVEVTSENPVAQEVVFKEFERVEKMCSLFDKSSELARLNASGGLVVSRELFDLLKKAQLFYVMTDGAFDPTVAPVSSMWKKAIALEKVPGEQEVRDGLSYVGFDYVYLNEKDLSVKLLKMGVQIDLGAIAKGYALDCSIKRLKELQIDSAIVNAGGDLYCLGKNCQHSWRVGIQDPRHKQGIMSRFEIENKAVATSGDYEQFFTFQNKRYSHIIDPKTGYPAVSGVVSATVVAPDVLTADVLATAFVVLGFDKSVDIVSRFQGIEAKLIAENGKILSLSSGLKS
ncbi:MAG: FAD:protein FMN transferase [Candidatus Omnitrophota bacterium]